MKLTFAIIILFTLLPFNFAQFQQISRCFGLEEAAVQFGHETDLLVEFHKIWKNRTTACQNEQPGNELAAKQLAFVNSWIEMPEKLKTTEEEKNNLTVELDKMAEENKNLTFAFVDLEDSKKTWKVSQNLEGKNGNY